MKINGPTECAGRARCCNDCRDLLCEPVCHMLGTFARIARLPFVITFSQMILPAILVAEVFYHMADVPYLSAEDKL